MSELPDEIWMKILEVGIAIRGLSWKDLCSLSISCRRFDRLSKDESLWALLLCKEFATLSSNSPSKEAFRIKFERHKSLKLAQYRREVLKVESRIASESSEVKDASSRLMAERKKLDMTLQELWCLKRGRQASVALNVWQPEIVRTKRKQIVEQNPVHVDSHIHTLEMEIKLCRLQISRFSRNLECLKEKLEASKEYLASLKYHPLQSNRPIGSVKDSRAKSKKMKMNKEPGDGQSIGEEARSS